MTIRQVVANLQYLQDKFGDITIERLMDLEKKCKGVISPFKLKGGKNDEKENSN